MPAIEVEVVPELPAVWPSLDADAEHLMESVVGCRSEEGVRAREWLAAREGWSEEEVVAVEDAVCCGASAAVVELLVSMAGYSASLRSSSPSQYLGNVCGSRLVDVILRDSASGRFARYMLSIAQGWSSTELASVISAVASGSAIAVAYWIDHAERMSAIRRNAHPPASLLDGILAGTDYCSVDELLARTGPELLAHAGVSLLNDNGMSSPVAHRDATRGSSEGVQNETGLTTDNDHRRAMDRDVRCAAVHGVQDRPNVTVDDDEVSNEDAQSPPAGSAVQSYVLPEGDPSFAYIPFFGSSDPNLPPCLFDDEVPENVVDLLSAHGMDGSDWSVRRRRSALIYHLASGQCADGAQGQSCRVVTGPSMRPSDIACIVLEKLIQSDATELSTSRSREICIALQLTDRRLNRASCVKLLQAKLDSCRSLAQPTEDILSEISRLRKPGLLAWSAVHHVPVDDRNSIQEIRSELYKHISLGHCANYPIDGLGGAGSGCGRLVRECSQSEGRSVDNVDLQIFLLSSLAKRSSKSGLRRILELHNIPYAAPDSVSRLRSYVRKHVRYLSKGKLAALAADESQVQDRVRSERLAQIQDSWPRPRVSNDLKRRILQMFRTATSTDALKELTCASCAGCYFGCDCVEESIGNLNLSLLEHDGPWTSRAVFPSVPGLPSEVMVDKDGVLRGGNDAVRLRLCKECAMHLRNFRPNAPRPPLSLANGLFLGDVPPELQELTIVEEAMIARCRAKCWIVQLKDEDGDVSSKGKTVPYSQRGLKGHIIIYPQDPDKLSDILPPPMNDITTPICVIFVGAKRPTPEWLRANAKPLCVRKEKVLAALRWLKHNNPLYFDVQIDENCLAHLDDEDVLPYHIEHQLPDRVSDVLTSRYDSYDRPDDRYNTPDSMEDETPSRKDVEFQRVVISDVDGTEPSDVLRRAAFRHIRERGGSFVELTHLPKPVNEFHNPNLLPMVYPTLFPYGIGGLEDTRRASALSFERHVKHLFTLSDRRFQGHHSFLFTVFNILQRRASLLHTSLRVKKDSFSSIAADLASVSPHVIHGVMERAARGDHITVKSPDEAKVLKLMREVNAVTGHVHGSSASKVVMRNEIRGMMASLGLPSFYVTLNPADLYSPGLRVLAGEDIDMDQFIRDSPPNYRKQSLLVANNPAVAAKFFHVYMTAFIEHVLRYDPSGTDLEGGALGLVKGYYGCVESQGRGTLHCHMLIWVEGALNPNQLRDRLTKQGDIEFRDRLLSMLDDSISTSVPADPGGHVHTPSERYHPATVRGPPLDQSEAAFVLERQKDLHLLAEACQRHKHTDTCYKYCRESHRHPASECRFELGEDKYRADSFVDEMTGEICLRCLDGLVNNFNETILETMRCNMDIKFIGSGASAKAILYYITDYITKSQLKAHVAYAALKLAVEKLGQYNPQQTEQTIIAKRMLQKCAYAMISNQELSAPQVMSYVYGYGDHYTSHEFRSLYWPSFESFIEKQLPSPECSYKPRSPTSKLPISDDSLSDDDSGSEDAGEPGDEDDIGVSMMSDPSSTASAPLSRSETLVDQEEITIGVLPTGEIVARAGQVKDYVHRAVEFGHMTVWDMVAQLDKVKGKGLNHTPDQLNVDTLSGPSDPSVGSSTVPDRTAQRQSLPTSDLDRLLFDRTRRRLPAYALNDDHSDHNTHCQVLRRPRTMDFRPFPALPAP